MAKAPLQRNVVLAGFMGTGKSTVGALLARRLSYEFVDSDALIEQDHGPIADIFTERGEAAFRDIERDLVSELADRSGLVIATGGGLVLDDSNTTRLAATGRIFCLRADIGELVQRLMGSADGAARPLLGGPDPASRIRQLLAERAAIYERFEQVETTARSPAQVTDHILSLLDQQPTPI